MNPSVITHKIKPVLGLPRILRSYPSYAPTSVRFRYVPCSPISFLQTPLLPVTPLPAGSLPTGAAVEFLTTLRLVGHAGQTKKNCPFRGSFFY